MHKQKFALENETEKFIFNFEIKINHQIPTKRPYLALINKKKRSSKFCHSRKKAINWINT